MEKKERVRKMDEMKLNLSSRFMRMLVAKFLSKMIKKKYGYKIDVFIGEIQLDMIDGNAHVHVNADLEMVSEEFKKLLSAINED